MTQNKHDFKEALEVIKNHQKWRKGCDVTPPTSPEELSKALYCAMLALRIAEAVQNDLVENISYVMFKLQDMRILGDLPTYEALLKVNKILKEAVDLIQRETENGTNR